MSNVSTGKSILAKLATTFAIGFVVSLGLCGVNFLLLAGGGAVGRSGGATVLIVLAYLEVAGMVICAIGLLVVGLIAAAQATHKSFSNTPNSSEEDK